MKYPHRLAWPRTPAFHAGDRGSNPRGDANIKKGLSNELIVLFCFLSSTLHNIISET